ncbi:MAG: CopG family transcriptional regulator [Candidatus Tectomicrobia bacterium]|nr:CopG family transcriptional regulator [Candidatus Tectomicrobia bacterium]
MATSSARISFVTEASKRARLDAIAEVCGKNLSAVINEALDQYIELYEWQLQHIRQGVEEAKRGEFATDSEVDAFFNQYGQSS